MDLENIEENIDPALEESAKKRGTKLVRSAQATPSGSGTPPTERSIEELLESSVINLDKPAGPTSHQVSAWVRDMLGVKKAGHGGTLDPNVTGVLPIVLNRAVRLTPAILSATKEYVGVMRLHHDVDDKKVDQVIEEFTGEIYQFPPVKSAVKRQLRTRTIKTFTKLERQEKDILIHVDCQAGTYIRTLMNDIGTVLGTGAQMTQLRRTRSGTFFEKDSFTLHQVKDAFVTWKEDGDETGLRDILLPVETLLEHLPKVYIRDSAVDAICHGANLALPGITEIEGGIRPGDHVDIVTIKNETVALGSATLDSFAMFKGKEGVAVEIVRVLMEPGTYPKMWRSPK